VVKKPAKRGIRSKITVGMTLGSLKAGSVSTCLLDIRLNAESRPLPRQRPPFLFVSIPLYVSPESVHLKNFFGYINQQICEMKHPQLHGMFGSHPMISIYHITLYKYFTNCTIHSHSRCACYPPSPTIHPTHSRSERKATRSPKENQTKYRKRKTLQFINHQSSKPT